MICQKQYKLSNKKAVDEAIKLLRKKNLSSKEIISIPEKIILKEGMIHIFS